MQESFVTTKLYYDFIIMLPDIQADQRQMLHLFTVFIWSSNMDILMTVPHNGIKTVKIFSYPENVKTQT